MCYFEGNKPSQTNLSQTELIDYDLTRFYDWYSFEIIPVLGEVISKDWDSYQYLVESIRKFPDQESFKQIIEEKGFTLVNYENFFNGIASVHYGFKPL